MIGLRYEVYVKGPGNTTIPPELSGLGPVAKNGFVQNPGVRRHLMGNELPVGLPSEEGLQTI
jgi:hypothetical protein